MGRRDDSSKPSARGHLAGSIDEDTHRELDDRSYDSTTDDDFTDTESTRSASRGRPERGHKTALRSQTADLEHLTRGLVEGGIDAAFGDLSDSDDGASQASFEQRVKDAS